MCDNSRLKSVPALMAIICMLSAPARAQNGDSLYALTAYVGAGYTRNFSKFQHIPGLAMKPARNGMSAFVRVMWTPEHLLSVGLETGFARVYSMNAEPVQTPFGATKFNSILNVIPFSLTFSMHVTKQLEGYIASTSYLLYSYTKSFGSNTYGTMLSIGFSAALSYTWTLNEDWSAGCELKWYHIEKSKDDNVMFEVVVSYKFLEW